MLSMSSASAEDYLWSGYWYNANKGAESRTWSDEKYSEVLYRFCSGPRSDNGSTPYKTAVQMHRDISMWPDANYDTKSFTECFGGYMHQSKGAWHDLPKGTYYFSVEGVWGGVGRLSVEKVMVDTTAAD